MFFVEKPRDSYGNVGHGYQVIEGNLIDEGDGFASIEVVAPESFKKSWSSVAARFFMETTGPVRELTFEEWSEITGFSKGQVPEASVILKNGAEEQRTLVTVVMMSLETLMEEHPLAFYELVEVCKDPNHKIFGNNADFMSALSLLDSSGKVHQSVRNIVLAAATGEGLNLSLGNPIKDSE